MRMQRIADPLEQVRADNARSMLKTLQPAMLPEELAQAQRQLREIHASSNLVTYVQALAQASRQNGLFADGLSPRATIALLHAATSVPNHIASELQQNRRTLTDEWLNATAR